MSKVEVYCDNCGKPFLRAKKEVKRSIKLGRKSFCSRTCVGKSNIGNFGDNVNTDASHLDPSNRKDIYSEYRWHLRRIKQRNHTHNLTLQDLKEVFEKQDGKCTYSKVKLLHPKIKQKSNHITTASLDRIDSSKGYVKGNIQFISIAMNHMKSNMTHEETLEMINILKNS